MNSAKKYRKDMMKDDEAQSELAERISKRAETRPKVRRGAATPALILPFPSIQYHAALLEISLTCVHWSKSRLWLARKTTAEMPGPRVALNEMQSILLCQSWQVCESAYIHRNDGKETEKEIRGNEPGTSDQWANKSRNESLGAPEPKFFAPQKGSRRKCPKSTRF